MQNDVFKELERLAGDNKAKFSYNGLSGKLKNSFDNRSLLAKIRNALLVYLVLIAIFKISTGIAGKYLSGDVFASFMAYFSFFLLILGGLFLSFYFPMKYSTAGGKGKGKGITIKLPSISFKRKPQLPKGEKELQKMLQNERKNVVKASREKDSVAKQLNDSQSKCERLQIEKKEFALKNKELERASSKKRDFSGLADVLLPKKEVVSAEKGGKEMPKIKITGHDRKLAKKYKKLPGKQHQRVELYRNIARSIQKEEAGASFTVAQVMEVLIELFRHAIDDDRKKALKEVQDWVKEDDYTPLIKAEKGVSYYRIIK